MTAADNLRHEHDHLHAGLDRLADLVGSLGELPPAAVQAGVERTLGFFRTEVGPHARAEERVLYPEIARLLNVHLSSGLIREHHQIEQLVGELEQNARRLRQGVRVVPGLHAQLAGLHRTAETHLLHEEQLILTLLDEHLTEAEGYSLFERMELATFDAVVAARDRGLG